MTLTPQLPLAILDALRAIVGADHVLTSPEARLAWECDALSVAKGAPDAVVLVQDAAQVSPILTLLAREKIPFLPRGAGTGLVLNGKRD